MENNDLFIKFSEHMKVKNYSPATLAAYGSHLLCFFDYLRDTGISDIRRVTHDVLKSYQIRITEQRKEGKGYSTATISMKIRAVKRFFKYLEYTHQILINPAEQIKEPRKETMLPRTVLTADEVKRILEQPRLDSAVGIRDRMILEIFYSTGIRLEEMTNLTIFDCDLQGGFLRVNKGKGAKDRLIPLGKHAVMFLKEYISRVRPRYAGSNKSMRFLFLSRFGQPLSKQIIEIFVRGYAKKAGITKKVTPHAFRHTFATELVRNGADITAVRKMLGHSSLSITHVYTKVAGLDVKKTHSSYHPREKDLGEMEETLPDIRGIKEQSSHE